MAPKKEPKLARMNINIDRQLHDAFKAATAVQGANMTDVLLEFIRDYVRQHLPGGRKK